MSKCASLQSECYHNNQNLNEFDYIIVGSGTSGAIIAKELSDDFYNRVLLLEQGEYEINNPIITDVTDPNKILQHRNFYTAIPPRNDGSFSSNPIINARTVGGSSAINRFLAARPSPNYHRKLADNYGSDWNYYNALEIYKKLEDYNGKLTANRSVGGPVGIFQYPAGNSSFVNLFSQGISTVNNAPIDLDYNNGYNSVVGTGIQKFQHRD
jgi:choline dehydrogenase